MNKGEYKGLKGNTELANKMNKGNINKYLKAFVMQNLEDGKVELSREYRNRSTDNGYIKENMQAVRSLSYVDTNETGISRRQTLKIKSHEE